MQTTDIAKALNSGGEAGGGFERGVTKATLGGGSNSDQNHKVRAGEALMQSYSTSCLTTSKHLLIFPAEIELVPQYSRFQFLPGK